MSRLRAILAAGGKCKTADGSDAEIFAERDGVFYGMVLEFPVAGWTAARWSMSGICFGTSGGISGVARFNIPAPAPVRKWRWVMRAPSGDLWVTSGHYATEQECAVTHNTGWKAIQRIDATEIRE